MSFFGFYSDTYGNLSEFHPFKNGSADSSGVRTVSKGTSGGGNRVRGGATHRVYPPIWKWTNVPQKSSSSNHQFSWEIVHKMVTFWSHLMLLMCCWRMQWWLPWISMGNGKVISHHTSGCYGKSIAHKVSCLVLGTECKVRREATDLEQQSRTFLEDMGVGQKITLRDRRLVSHFFLFGFSRFPFFFLRVFFSKGWDEVGDGVACNKAYIYLFGSR